MLQSACPRAYLPTTFWEMAAELETNEFSFRWPLLFILVAIHGFLNLFGQIAEMQGFSPFYPFPFKETG